MIGREYTAEEAARVAVADQFRRLATEVMRGAHAETDLLELAERLRSEADALALHPDRERDYTRFEAPDSMPVPADGEEFFNSPDRPFSGLGQPWSLPMRVFRQGDRAIVDLTLDISHQGAPGMAHGGFVAAIFDDLLGFLLSLQETIAFTAWLTVNYHEGTMIGEPLRFEAWIDRVEGKKLFLCGECRDSVGELVSSAEGLFIDATEHFRRLAGE
ncbi:MAG: PaaI family thioesterase [Actinomycetota bacterium]